MAAGSPADGDIALVSRVTDGVEESLESCFACHALKDVVQEGYLPGAPLADYHALKLPVLGDDPYLPDGRVRTFAYQATHLSSACYVDGGMTCVSCHEPHGLGYWDINRTPLASETDDRQCTSCHASKADDPVAHTFHPPESPGSRCVSCHMPYLQHPEVGNAVPFAPLRPYDPRAAAGAGRTPGAGERVQGLPHGPERNRASGPRGRMVGSAQAA